MLSDKQVKDIWDSFDFAHDRPIPSTPFNFARAIERAARKEAFEECAEQASGFPFKDTIADSIRDWAEAKAKEAGE